MYCPNCGAYNSETYNNCIYCGKYIAEINKELALKGEHEIKVSSTENDTISGDTKQLHIKPITISEKVDEHTSESPYIKHSVRKYGESIYRQNIKKPKDYFIFALICAFLGSLPLGVAAVISSVMTKAESYAGNINKAGIYSERTKIFCIISAIIGAIKFILIFAIFMYYYSIMTYYNSYMW